MTHEAEALRCCYCLQIITVDDDAQRVSKHANAHTDCAFAVSDAFFFFAHVSNEE